MTGVQFGVRREVDVAAPRQVVRVEQDLLPVVRLDPRVEPGTEARRRRWLPRHGPGKLAGEIGRVARRASEPTSSTATRASATSRSRSAAASASANSNSMSCSIWSSSGWASSTGAGVGQLSTHGLGQCPPAIQPRRLGRPWRHPHLGEMRVRRAVLGRIGPDGRLATVVGQPLHAFGAGTPTAPTASAGSGPTSDPTAPAVRPPACRRRRRGDVPPSAPARRRVACARPHRRRSTARDRPASTGDCRDHPATGWAARACWSASSAVPARTGTPCPT